MKVKARFPLADVFAIIDSGDPERIWFSAPPRSIFAVLKVYGKSNSAKAFEEFKNFILSGIKALTEQNFVESIIQWNDPKCVADVYGLIFDGKPWYVKFRIDEDGVLEEISFHPPEKEMKTVGGMRIPAGGTP